MRSGQVTQLQNNFQIVTQLQCFRDSYETFGIWWGRQCLHNVYLGFLISVTSGQVILRLPIISQLLKKINSVIFTLAQAYLSGIISYRTVVDNSSKNLHCLPLESHLWSPEVTNRHLPITFNQIEIATWEWCQNVRLGQANRLICNMTHFGHHVTLAWLDLWSNFDLDLSKSLYT